MAGASASPTTTPAMGLVLHRASDEVVQETVNHSIEEWVDGDVHMNSIEGVWSLFKRSIIGAFHKV